MRDRNPSPGATREPTSPDGRGEANPADKLIEPDLIAL
jgi:hypothetical protein